MLRIRDIDHLVLRVRDVEAMVRFYGEVLGCPADAILGHLRAHGIEPGAVKPRFGAEGRGPSLYLEDPEGNTVELKGPPEDPQPPNP